MNMYDKLYKNFDKLKPTEEAVSRAVESAIKSDCSKEEIKLYNLSKRNLTLSITAACLVFVFVAAFVFSLAGGATVSPQVSSNYNFVITANASQAEALKIKESSTIAAYAGILSGGWAMYPNLERYEDFSPNFFQSYAFTNFSIEGKGIESVTFKSKAVGTYFAISPAGYFVNADEDTAEQITEEAMSEYSDMSLQNSQYTASQLRDYSDGLSYGKIYCDTFTYTNTQSNDVINLSNKLEFIVESNNSNKVISEKLDAMWQCEQKIIESKSQDSSEGGEISQEEEKLYQELDRLSLEIRQLVLSDSTVDVTVRFTDGSVQTKSLRMGLAQADDETYWLTVTEE